MTEQFAFNIGQTNGDLNKVYMSIGVRPSSKAGTLKFKPPIIHITLAF